LEASLFLLLDQQSGIHGQMIHEIQLLLAHSLTHLPVPTYMYLDCICKYIVAVMTQYDEWVMLWQMITCY